MDVPADQAPLSYLAYTLPPRPEDVTGDEVLDRFLEYVRHLGLTPYAAQEEAILELCADKNVILTTPTGSGKSLVATAAHFLALARQTRSFYTAPIKALVNEKFFALCREFGADNVGMITGDASVNPDAPIVCCTAEILANFALSRGEALDVALVVMDEFHYYSERERGAAWQIPLLTLPQARFVLMSATFGDPTFFARELTRLNGSETAVVSSTERPVPLDFEYRESPLNDTLRELLESRKTPVYLVHFTQRACAEEAQNLTSIEVCSKDEKKAIGEALRGVRFDTPYGKECVRLLRHGIGLHHAGLLPKYRLLVEKLAQRGLLKVIVGTDTLGVGVNIPIRTVLFTQLCKYDGEKSALLRVRDFHQIAGRAGRRGFDTQGSVLVQAPEHVIENQRLENKAGGDPKKLRKMVRRKPPERGYVAWDRAAFEKLLSSQPEPLVSRFSVTHGMLMSLLSRHQHGCRAALHLLRDSHEPARNKKKLRATGLAMFQSLVKAQILEPNDTGGFDVHADLQEDFSLNRALSLFLVEVVSVLDRESPTYALDLLSLVESIVEDPSLVLMRQLDQLKTRRMAELKMAGVEYEERIAELDKVQLPKPCAELLYGTFDMFVTHHPWLSGENVRPKSVARDMIEQFLSFTEYIKEYGLERAEGLLLRYLSDVYKVLVRSVPALAKTPEVEDVEVYLRAMLRATDSSLLDEWESLQQRPSVALEEEPSVATPADRLDVTADQRGFLVLVRSAAFMVVRALARRDFVAAAGCLADGSANDLELALRPYFAEFQGVRSDAAARGPKWFRTVSQDPSGWVIEQVLLAPEGDGFDEETDEVNGSDWFLRFSIDLAACREQGKPVLRLAHAGM